MGLPDDGGGDCDTLSCLETRVKPQKGLAGG